jgi:hypothetical protein
MFPERIVCLSAESANICAKLGAGSRVVGVSAFAPKELRQDRHSVSGFSTLKHDELLVWTEDLVGDQPDACGDRAMAKLAVTALCLRHRIA